MSFSPLLAICLFAVPSIAWYGPFDHENRVGHPAGTSKLQFKLPQKLRKEGGYEHKDALFGEIPYGGSIVTNIYQTSTDMCIYDREDISWESPFVLMINRGGCTFVTKVRNAQHAGAAAVIIADNTCLCSDSNCVSEGDQRCESNEPIMSDDGSGSDVRIPSMLMYKRDADHIKEEMDESNQKVQVELSWTLPKASDHVNYSVWITPTNELNEAFISNFRTSAVALGKHANFTPHMNIFSGESAGCYGLSMSVCGNLCTNNGMYCASDPDGDPDKGISGSDVVKESLRRICIWNEYGKDDGIGETWFNYVHQFARLCNSNDFFMNEDCIMDAYKHANIKADAIQSCMENSGGLIGDTPNALLQSQLDVKSEKGIVVFPAVLINDAPMRGHFTVGTVFEAVCAAFADDAKPQICDQCEKCGDPGACVNAKGVCAGSAYSTMGGNTGGRVSKGVFSLSILSVISLSIVLSFLYYQKTRREMQGNVRGIISEYMLLDENKNQDNQLL